MIIDAEYQENDERRRGHDERLGRIMDGKNPVLHLLGDEEVCKKELRHQHIVVNTPPPFIFNPTEAGDGQ